VVILNELEDNPGASVTNSVEEIAAAVVSANALPTTRTIFIEHYEPREVLRAGVWGKEIGTPSWKPLDRATVETLVGEEVGG
jgi:hypothetical protein